MAHEYRTKRRVAFSETDMAGIVHFANFFRYMEDAEHEFLRSLGLGVHREHETRVVSWPRVAATCDFHGPVYFEEEMDVLVRVLKKGTKSVTYGFEFARAGKKIASGTLTVVCCVLHPGRKPGGKARLESIAIPKFISEKLQVAPDVAKTH